MNFSTLEEVIKALKSGNPIIVADNEDRENEGDLIIPAQFATPDVINFMMKECRGIICLALENKIADKLELTEMVKHNTDYKKTAFTQSIDASRKFGVTTGVSAFDRAKTISVAIAQDTVPSDLTRPGHVFPLLAKKGGVLERPGHTEAAVDLMKISELTPAGVICEIVKPDGTMARRDFLFEFAEKYGFKFCTVENLVKYRHENSDKCFDVTSANSIRETVKYAAKAKLPTKYGMFEIRAYVNEADGVEHVALVKNDYPEKIPMVRVHSECLTGDALLSLKCDCGNQLEESIRMISEYGRGAVVYIRNHEGRGIGIANKIKAYSLQDKGEDTINANILLGFAPDLRHYDVAATILNHLGYSEIKLITNNPQKIEELSEYGLRITERIEIPSVLNEFNSKYIKTKAEKMEHLIKL